MEKGKGKARTCSPEGESPGSFVLRVLRAEILGEFQRVISIEYSEIFQGCPSRSCSSLIDGTTRAGGHYSGQLVLRSAVADFVALPGQELKYN